MGEKERENDKKIRRTRLQEAIILTIASGGRLGSAVLIPEVLSYLTQGEYIPSHRKREVTKTALKRLKENRLITFSRNYYVLTPEGTRVLEKWRRNDFQLTKPKKWDGKWRIIIFDIPEKKKSVREEIRRIFVNAGLQKLQDSVWVYPYDCEEIITLLKTDYGVSKDLLYIIADHIENDRHLRKEFDLYSPT